MLTMSLRLSLFPVAASCFSVPLPSVTRVLAGLAAAFALTIPTLVHANYEVAFAPGSTSGTYELGFTDSTNAPWIFQSSTDLVNWTNQRSFQVNNSGYRFSVNAAAAGPRVFFRIVSAAAGTTVDASRTGRTILPTVADNYSILNLPAHLLVPIITGQNNTPANNPVTDAGATLGRVLFYDTRLSANNSISCSSCHQPEHGFSDPRPLSTGFEGGLTDRNSMGLTSAKFYPRGSFFWDERAATLEDQVLQPIQNSVEMGMTLPALVTKLSAETYYAQLFTAAFGNATITSDRISRALAQFVRSIVSSNTKYDAGVASNFANFTAEENLGRQIFTGQVGNATCLACHGTDNFVPGNLNNNGIENPSIDRGVGAITGNPADNGKFKTNSLRNIGLTAPYMHDGRFATLEQVVEFYNSGVTAHPNLSAPLRNPPGSPGAGQPRRLNLTAAQKSALVAFLNTLTDTTVTTDPRFADPFRSGETIVLP
jgi:cytochrome c peroxidase